MPDASANPSMFAGSRLWILVGAVVVLVLLLAGGGYWRMKGEHKAAVAAKRPHLIGDLGDTVIALDTVAPALDKFCAEMLARALDFGVLPQGATLTSSEAQTGQPAGRFSCQAQGGDGKYTLIIDTACPNSQEKTCFALDSVRREDGAWAYKRHG